MNTRASTVNTMASAVTILALRMMPGQEYFWYDFTRISASTFGTFTANSCGGAYWHA